MSLINPNTKTTATVSKSVGVIQLSIVYIKNDNIKKLEQSLRVMPLESLNADKSDDLLSNFLSICASFNRKDAAKLILERWKVVYPESEKVQFLSQIFLINKINLPTLSFVVLAHEDYTYIECVDDLIELDSSPEVVTACLKADQIFGKQKHEVYRIVQDHAYELDNMKVYEYATDRMEETAPYANVPEWVKNYFGEIVSENELYDIDIKNFDIKLPSNEEAVELLTAGLYYLGTPDSEIELSKRILLEKLNNSTYEEKLKILRPVLENQSDQLLAYDHRLFRIFGPANPLVNQDLTLNTPSSKYGGCRMFLCDIFDFDEEENEPEDWFQGACDQCHLRIRHRWHAVRKPRVMGGWVGGYCSWDCVRESVHWDGEEPNVLVHEIIDIFEKQINEIGIQDRTETKNTE